MNFPFPITRPTCRHHRPYEGQQPVIPEGQRRGGHHVIIAPTRGSNLKERRVLARIEDGHHRPYEGQQHRHGQRDHQRRRGGSSSPLRGAATSTGHARRTRDHQRSSSPLRGAATCLCGPQSGWPTRGHHRPYEGQQLERNGTRHGQAPIVIIAPTRGSNCLNLSPPNVLFHVIIAPTRGSNMPVTAGPPGLLPVIIAPTRGSNVISSPVMLTSLRHHRPYEGQQQVFLGGEKRHADLSSSPLRGAATGGIGCGQGPQR